MNQVAWGVPLLVSQGGQDSSLSVICQCHITAITFNISVCAKKHEKSHWVVSQGGQDSALSVIC